MESSFLTDPLPERALIDGKSYFIHYDFKTAIRYHILLKDKEKSIEEKIAVALQEFYPVIPSDLGAAIDYMVWFYACGKLEKETSNKPQKDSMSFLRDGYLIYADFWEKYGIDLKKEDLHWWTFRALLNTILQGIGLRDVVYARSVKLAGMSKEAKKYYSMLKREFALEQESVSESIEEHKAKIKEYVDRRFKEASESKERIDGKTKMQGELQGETLQPDTVGGGD